MAPFLESDICHAMASNEKRPHGLENHLAGAVADSLIGGRFQADYG
jgi:hypothetical protein